MSYFIQLGVDHFRIFYSAECKMLFFGRCADGGNETNQVYDNSCYLPGDNSTECQQFVYDDSIFTNTVVSQV